MVVFPDTISYIFVFEEVIQKCIEQCVTNVIQNPVSLETIVQKTFGEKIKNSKNLFTSDLIVNA